MIEKDLLEYPGNLESNVDEFLLPTSTFWGILLLKSAFEVFLKVVIVTIKCDHTKKMLNTPWHLIRNGNYSKHKESMKWRILTPFQNWAIKSIVDTGLNSLVILSYCCLVIFYNHLKRTQLHVSSFLSSVHVYSYMHTHTCMHLNRSVTLGPFLNILLYFHSSRVKCTLRYFCEYSPWYI